MWTRPCPRSPYRPRSDGHSTRRPTGPGASASPHPPRVDVSPKGNLTSETPSPAATAPGPAATTLPWPATTPAAAALPTAPGRTARPTRRPPRTARRRSSRVHRRPHPGDAPGVRHHLASQRGHEHTGTPARPSRSRTAPGGSATSSAPVVQRRRPVDAACTTWRRLTCRHSPAGPPLRRARPRRPLAVGQAGQRVSSTSAPVPVPRHAGTVPTPTNRTASAATPAGLPRTAVTARTTPSRRSLLHRPQTSRGGGMGANQIVRRRQRLGSQPRHKQRTSGYRHRVIAKPGQGVDSPP